MGSGYNGWSNYETWNVSLWLNNDEGLYHMACAFMRDRVAKGGSKCNSYAIFVGLNMDDASSTPDGIKWYHPDLDLNELDEMMWEMGS